VLVKMRFRGDELCGGVAPFGIAVCVDGFEMDGAESGALRVRVALAAKTNLLDCFCEFGTTLLGGVGCFELANGMVSLGVEAGGCEYTLWSVGMIGAHWTSKFTSSMYAVLVENLDSESAIVISANILGL
jgi:hypothetical protein